jgi:transcriptional regulator with XRE-family HTH domain
LRFLPGGKLFAFSLKVVDGHSQVVSRDHGPAEAGHDSPSSLAAVGELLRRAREERGLTLEQIARDTKIPISRLDAIEHDNVAALAVDFYRRAEARTYARAVGLDQRLVSAELDRAQAARVDEPSPAPDTRTPLVRAGVMLLLIGGSAVAVLLGRTLLQRQAVAAGDAGVVPDRPIVRRSMPSAQPASAAVLSPPPTTADRAPAVSRASLPVAAERAETESSVATSGRSTTVATQSGAGTMAVDPVTELVVTTDPPGARVTVNGVAWGTAPVTIRYLPAGDKRIRASKDGYAVEERLMRLKDGARQSVELHLQTAAVVSR